MKVKVISGNYPSDIENGMNNWLISEEAQGIEVLQMTQSQSTKESTHYLEVCYTLTILYR
ncbi:MAG: hypothetical protein WC979_02630 [Candidatus Pacearchaeota archaeon]|jgi:hypothetical protein|nr:hypothetical protein [Clostridia bacterium]